MPVRRVLAVALLLASSARTEEEPTPFWMPPPLKKAAPAKLDQKPAKKKPVRIEPLRIKRKKKPPVAEKRNAPPARPEPSMEPTWIDPAPHAADPLPPPQQAPVEVETATRPLPSAPPVVAPPEPPAPAAPAAVVLAKPETEPHAEGARRFSAGASFGAWGKSRSDGAGRDWQLAYGLRLSGALLPALEVELELLRAGGSAGSPFVSASAAHNLAALRAFWVVGGASGDGCALLLGGGGGAALSQTHYTLQPSTDPSVVATDSRPTRSRA